MSKAKIVELEGVTAGYDGITILHNVNLEIFEGDFIGVIGPNGGGKTTLIRIILEQIPLLSGNISYFGNIKNEMGYLPQNNKIDNQFPISVSEVVLSGLQAKKGFFGTYSAADKGRAIALLKRCSIDRLYKQSIGHLSGGELQRVLLCRALISAPKLLILDEPNTFVDNKFEKELYELLKELNKEITIIMVSHDLGTITPYVKSIACVNRNLHYHKSNVITQEQLLNYDCPILLVAHGEVPHTVLCNH